MVTLCGMDRLIDRSTNVFHPWQVPSIHEKCVIGMCRIGPPLIGGVTPPQRGGFGGVGTQ
jgi:hypothetical protein